MINTVPDGLQIQRAHNVHPAQVNEPFLGREYIVTYIIIGLHCGCIEQINMIPSMEMSSKTDVYTSATHCGTETDSDRHSRKKIDLILLYIKNIGLRVHVHVNPTVS